MKFRNVIPVFFIMCLNILGGCASNPAADHNTIDSVKPNLSQPDTTSANNEIENKINEKRFALESDGYKLNAVYTYVDDQRAHPAVLLIAGSGPSDCDGTIGALKPLEDMAKGLAQNGINSLRVDKRTFEYASEFDVKCGIKEEYLNDCRTAIDFLKNQNISGLYLIGHSLGGQIATELAVNDDCIDGLILFNSSARHLADIARDQYILLDPPNKESYIGYANAAKKATDKTAKGYYYYGAGDYYWASYNKINVVNNISELNSDILIINSTFDKQSFDEDLNMWTALFADYSNITIHIFDDISHLGYKIDTDDQSALHTCTEFPNEIISAFIDFIKNN